MTEQERELQRLSFAYGNTHFENELITKDTVNQAAEELRAGDAKDGHSARYPACISQAVRGRG